MATVTKPILLDETGQDIVTKLQAIAAAVSAQGMETGSLSNPSSITLDSSAKRTYTTVTLSSRTSVTLSGGAANPGYEHYLLFHNTHSADCAITPASGMVAPAAIKVPAGKYLELAYLYNGSAVIITNSSVIE